MDNPPQRKIVKKTEKTVTFAEHTIFQDTDSDSDELSGQSYQMDSSDPIEQVSTDTCDSDTNDPMEVSKDCVVPSCSGQGGDVDSDSSDSLDYSEEDEVTVYMGSDGKRLTDNQHMTAIEETAEEYDNGNGETGSTSQVVGIAQTVTSDENDNCTDASLLAEAGSDLDNSNSQPTIPNDMDSDDILGQPSEFDSSTTGSSHENILDSDIPAPMDGSNEDLNIEPVGNLENPTQNGVDDSPNLENEVIEVAVDSDVEQGDASEDVTERVEVDETDSITEPTCLAPVCATSNVEFEQLTNDTPAETMSIDNEPCSGIESTPPTASEHPERVEEDSVVCNNDVDSSSTPGGISEEGHREIESISRAENFEAVRNITPSVVPDVDSHDSSFDHPKTVAVTCSNDRTISDSPFSNDNKSENPVDSGGTQAEIAKPIEVISDKLITNGSESVLTDELSCVKTSDGASEEGVCKRQDIVVQQTAIVQKEDTAESLAADQEHLTTKNEEGGVKQIDQDRSIDQPQNHIKNDVLQTVNKQRDVVQSVDSETNVDNANNIGAAEDRGVNVSESEKNGTTDIMFKERGVSEHQIADSDTPRKEPEVKFIKVTVEDPEISEYDEETDPTLVNIHETSPYDIDTTEELMQTSTDMETSTDSMFGTQPSTTSEDVDREVAGDSIPAGESNTDEANRDESSDGESADIAVLSKKRFADTSAVLFAQACDIKAFTTCHSPSKKKTELKRDSSKDSETDNEKKGTKDMSRSSIDENGKPKDRASGQLSSSTSASNTPTKQRKSEIRDAVRRVSCEKLSSGSSNHSLSSSGTNKSFETVQERIGSLDKRNASDPDIVFKPPPGVQIDHSVGLEYFTGGSSWKEYLQNFEAFCEANTWIKPVRASYLFAHLRGRAKQVACKLSAEEQRDFDHLVAVLGRFFTARDEAELHLFELRNRVRKPKETLQELANEVRRLTNLAYPEIPDVQKERLSRIHFLDALKNNAMLKHIYGGKPDTLEQAVMLGVEFEGFKRLDAEKHRQSPRPKSFDESTLNGEKSEMEKRFEELAKGIGEIKSTLSNSDKSVDREST